MQQATRSARQPTDLTSATGVGVLDKAISVIQVLAGGGPMTVAELAQVCGVARPTVHRLVASLVAHQVLERNGETVSLGIRLIEWAHSAGAGRTLALVADSVMAELSAETGESVQLYVRRGDARVCVLVHEPRAGLRDSVPVGAVLPLDAGSGGRILTVYEGVPGVGESMPVQPSTPESSAAGSITHGSLAAGRTARDKGLTSGQAGAEAEVRKRGWASSLGEREAGVASVSSPVFDRAGRLLAALCVSGPIDRIAPRLEELGQDVRNASQTITQRLG
jgi:DNA-binding IclR family transcriptional regulator